MADAEAKRDGRGAAKGLGRDGRSGQVAHSSGFWTARPLALGTSFYVCRSSTAPAIGSSAGRERDLLVASAPLQVREGDTSDKTRQAR